MGIDPKVFAKCADIMRMKSFAVLVLVVILIAFGVMVFTFAKNVLPKESRLVELSDAS